MSERTNVSFRRKSPEGDILYRWWAGLQQDKGARARLRRCASPDEVMMEPAFYQLLNLMRPTLYVAESRADESAYAGLAAVVGLLSHVEGPDDHKLAERMADSSGGRPLLSSLRFRRLLKSSRDQLYPAMIRVLRMLNRKADIFDLAASVFFWGDTVRKHWALAYFPKVTEKS